MRLRALLATLILGLTAIGALWAQRMRNVPPDLQEFLRDDSEVPPPPDWNEKTEFAFSRLRYTSKRNGYFGRGGGQWSTDYPKADRQFMQGVKRLTRLHVRSMEQVVSLKEDEFWNYPWMYAVEVGRWDLNELEAKKLREYLLKGGFLMVDDFHGTFEWGVFMESMHRVFPERPVVDLDNKDQIFHVIYDLDQRFQVPGVQFLFTGQIWENDGVEAKWRGIYDDKGRVMVAICHNMDLGDAWEWADHPKYPEHYASLAYRIGVNYIIYAMTH